MKTSLKYRKPQDKSKVSVVNLADVIKQDPSAFRKYFKQAQDILHNSIPSGQIEPTPLIKDWILEQSNGWNEEWAFHYLVAESEGEVLGVKVYEFVILDEKTKESFIFRDYSAVAPNQRGSGVAKLLESVAKEHIASHSEEYGLSLIGEFSEIVKPSLEEIQIIDKYKHGEQLSRELYEMNMRNAVVPTFHHYQNNLGAMVVVDNQDKPHLVYYAMPDFSTDDNKAIKLLAAYSMMADGERVPLTAEPGSVIDENGRFKLDYELLPNMSKEKALEILGAVVDTYIEFLPEREKLMERILRRIERSIYISGKDSVYLIPIADTASLNL